MKSPDDTSNDLSLLAERLRARSDTKTSIETLDKVVEKYGMVEGEQFSFDGHEFQREIIRDTASRQAIRKCSQVGLSEVLVQKIIAMLSVLHHKRIILTLPTRDMAAKFSKDRVDGLIDQSEFYSGMVVKANNSASQKKIGSSMLYIAGTFGDTGAISVPAEIVVSDEIDFSNPDVLGKLSSRLRHAKEDKYGFKGVHIKFSTPTVDDYGVDAEFKQGDQKYYHCKCSSCHRDVVPDFLNDFIIPGYNGGYPNDYNPARGCSHTGADHHDGKEISALQRIDFSRPQYDFSASWIACPHCRADLWSDLCDPTRRSWIALNPTAIQSSYQVYPWDVPKYNTPASIIRQFLGYNRVEDFYNFVIGIPFTSPDNAFIVSDLHMMNCNNAPLYQYPTHVVPKSPRLIAGMDVGKTCHLSIGYRSGGQTYVVWNEEIEESLESPAAPVVLERLEFFNVKMLCVDAGPSFTLVNQLINEAPKGTTVCAVEYARSVPGVSIVSANPDTHVVKADRTKTLDNLKDNHNAQRIHYTRQYAQAIFSHLKALKRISQMNERGEMVVRYVKSGADHWGHSLNYLNIAALVLDEDEVEAPPASAPTMMGGVRVGSRSPSALDQPTPEPFSLRNRKSNRAPSKTLGGRRRRY